MLENSSKTTFTMSKKEGQTSLSVQMSNGSEDEKTLALTVKDSQTGNILPSTVGGVDASGEITLPAKSAQNLVVDITNAIGQVLVELSGAGGVSMRQKSSSSGGKSINLIELMLK